MKQLVLVLDNCEHVIGAAAEIASAMLHVSSAVRVLATSREPLLTEGECLYRVLPLAVPAEDIDDRRDLLRSGAVQLFVARARAADPHFSLDGRAATVAAQICRRLDGIPLAIELAAARGAVLGIEELASRLDDRFHLLTGGHRTAPSRHQTLRATLDWSYELLPESERMVLRRLAIFAGGFGLDAAGLVAASAEIAPSVVVNGVASLVTKSLVTPHPDVLTEPYRLLETTQAYALEKLSESGELAAVGRRHAECYRDLFRQAAAESETRPAAEWLSSYKPRIANLRAALDWAFSTTGDASVGVALTVAAAPLWMRLSLVDECRRRVEQALSAVAHGENRGTQEEMQLYAALGASLLYTKGPAPETGAAWTRALEIAERLDDIEYQLRALRGLWAHCLNNLEYRAALRLAQRFSSLAAKQSVPEDMLVGERMCGTALHYLGNQADARRHIERTLGGYPARAPPNRYQFDQRVTARATLARILWLQGFPDRAVRSARQSVEAAQASEDILSLCNALVQAACPVALFVGDLASAERYVAMLLDHSARHGLALWHVRGRGFEGMLLNQAGDTVTGLRHLGGALEELRETKYTGHLMAFLSAYAEASGRAGQVAEGLVAIDEALARSERTGGRWGVAELLRIKGELVLLESAPNAAEVSEGLFLQGLGWARDQGALSWELRVATSLSRLWRDGGRTKEALELLAPIYDRFTEGFGTADLIAAKALLDALQPSPSSEWERGPDTGKEPDVPPQPSERPAMLPLPDKPSVAVLPFTNMSGDPEQEFLADGIAEDVITALSHYPSLFVIARNSCFTYKGRAVDVKQVGRELGVRYVLEGSLRKSGNRLRVTAHLFEAETGKHVWAERYDRDLADIFALQDEIAEAVTIAIAPAIAGAERHRAMRKPPESLDAWAAYQRGLWYVGKANPDDNARSQRFFQQAIDLDPTFAGGYTGLAWAQLQAGTVFITGSFAQTQTSAEALARRAVALDDADAEARSCFGQALRHRGDYEGALAEAERALTTTPNLASAHGVLGSALLFSGRHRDGLAAVRRSIRLDPRDPALASRLNYMTIGLYFSREYEAAVEATKRAIRSYPEFPLPYRWLAAALGQTGRVEEARQALEQALAIAPTAFYLYVGQRVPWMRAEDHAHMLEGLHKAGWREKSARSP